MQDSDNLEMTKQKPRIKNNSQKQNHKQLTSILQYEPIHNKVDSTLHLNKLKITESVFKLQLCFITCHLLVEEVFLFFPKIFNHF